jgi:hypothetical protein
MGTTRAVDFARSCFSSCSLQSTARRPCPDGDRVPLHVGLRGQRQRRITPQHLPNSLRAAGPFEPAMCVS